MKGDTLSNEEIDDVLDLATMCPWQGGKSLGLAQALYAMVKDSTFSHSPFPCNETEDVEGRTFVHNTSNARISVFPNPAKDEITCKISDIGKKLRIYNILGEAVYQETIANEISKIDVSRYAPGIYHIVLYGPEIITTTKFTIHR